MTGTARYGPVHLAELLIDRGRLDEAWRAPLLAVPRHLFVPAIAWAVPNGPRRGGYPIDRAADPDAW